MIREELVNGESRLVKTVRLHVPHTHFPGAWDGRHVIREGDALPYDCEEASSIGRVFRTKAEGPDHLTVEVWIDPRKVGEQDKAALRQNSFTLTPMAYGDEGVPSHFTLSFNEEKGQIHMNNLIVNPKRPDPEPLVVQSLQELLQAEFNGDEETHTEKPGSSTCTGNSARTGNSPTNPLDEAIKKAFSIHAASEPEPLVVQSLEDHLKERHAQERTNETPAPKPQTNAPRDGLEVPDLAKYLQERERKKGNDGDR